MTGMLHGWTPAEDRFLMTVIRRGMDVREASRIMRHSLRDTERRLIRLRGNQQVDRLSTLIPGEFYELARGTRKAVVRFLRREEGRGSGRDKWLFALPVSRGVATFTAAQAADLDEIRPVSRKAAASYLDCRDADAANRRAADAVSVLGYAHQ